MILLDTHTFIWWVSDRKQLSETAREALEKEAGRLHLSVVSAWEVALLQKKNRLHLPMVASEFLHRGVFRHNIRELPLMRRTVLTAVDLPDIHNDPFDRILVAEALQARLAIVTKDPVIPDYPGVTTVW